MAKKLDRANVEVILALTPMQQGMLFHYLVTPESDMYFEQISFRIVGKVHPALVRQAWNLVVEANPSLRTVFRWSQMENPVQIILKQQDVLLREFDFSGLPQAEQEERVVATRVQDRQDKFDLEEVPFRITLCKFAAEEYEMIISNHHILYDGWSNTLVLQEFFQAYDTLLANRTPIKPIKNHLKEFIKYVRSQDKERQRAYWEAALEGFDRNAMLPYGASTQQAVGEIRLGELKYEFSKQLSAHAHQFVKERQITLATLLYTAWGIVLQKHNHTNDVLFGTTVSGRTLQVKGIEHMVGLFMNTVPLRVRTEAEAPLLDILRQVNAHVLERDEFASTSLVDIKTYAKADGQKSLFDCMVAVENFPLDGIFNGNYALQIKSLTVFEMTNFDLSLGISVADPIAVRFKFNADLFDSGMLERVAAQFEHLLQQIIANPQARVADLKIVTPEEKRQLLVDFAAERVEFPQGQTVPQRFEEQAASSPERIAVQGGEIRFTYGELNDRANRLAHFLREQGVRADRLVGVCMERSPELIVSLLAVLKAGGAYVPMDPAYPQERLAYLMEDSQIQVLLTREHLREKVSQAAVPTVLVDADWAEIAKRSGENLVGAVLPEQLAYVIYTSGSTGMPKGVQVAHGNLLNLVDWHQRAYEVTPQDRATLLAGPAFDASVWETWPYLTAGASLQIPDEETRMNPEALRDWLVESSITISFLPTPMAESLLALPWTAEAPLRYLLTGGDSLHGRPAAGLPFVLVNHYGPTEGTVVATAGVVEPDGDASVAPSIGRPIVNTEAYVLDAEQHLVPVGVPGELYIGGKGLTRGYLHRPELTEERFVRHPFADDPQARLYRTGDLVRYLPNGELEFVGRIDDQVKIRGFRIELGEIEAVLTGHPAVQNAVVLAREDVPGEKRLVAYVEVGADAGAELGGVLRGYLKGKMPDYMIPSAILLLPSLPLTANGKIDKRALPAPDQSQWSSETQYVAPRDQTEELVANIWAQILQLARVGIYDNFFELGGHSLMATQVMSRLREAFDVEVSLRSLFDHPTVAAWTAHVQALIAGTGRVEVPLVPVQREGRDLPLSFAQQRLWFLDRLYPDSALYNIPTVLRLEGEVSVTLLEQSLHVLIERHESLRTSIAEVDGHAIQVIAEQVDFHLPVVDLRAFSEPERSAEVTRRAQADAVAPFDLMQGPLWRAQLLQVGEREFVLLLNMHHIISDGWSIGVFLRELAAVYDAKLQGALLPQVKRSVQYADYAVWQREWLQGDVLEEQLSYWKQKLQGAEPLLQLPTDRPRPAVQTYQGTTYTLALSKALGERLNNFSRQEGVTLFMTLLAAFQTLLYRYTMQEDLLVGSPIAGRNRGEVEELIGFFVNTLVLRTDLSGNPSFKELLARVRETALGAYVHQDLPFEKIVDELQVERSLSYSPLFQVLFALQNAPLDLAGAESWSVRPYEADVHVVAKFDLTLYVQETDDHLLTIFEYNTDLFDGETIARMAEQYAVLLSAMTVNPEQRIGELPMLSVQELQQLEAWQGAKLEAVPNGCVHQLVEAQAARTPEATALVVDKQAVTYAELNARANQLAHHLRGRGVAAGHLVGLCTERSVEMVVGLLGILKAGAAYVPLDPLYPADRIAYTLEDAQVNVLLTQDRLVADLPEHNAHVIRLDADWQQIAQASTQNPECLSKSDDLAYVIYTSGSTGRPKGVAIEHRNTVTFIAWAQQVFTPEQMSGVLASTSICFDLSVFELFATLCMGGKVILAENALYLPMLAAKHEVTLINTVPSAAAELVRMNGIPESVRTVNLAGEPLPNALAQSLYDLGHVEAVYNLYGPSEDTTYSTYALVKKGATTAPTIGRPIANTEAYLLDPNGQRVPIGVPGELHLAGDGLARGYLHRADLTAEKFVANPFDKGKQPNARMYRTGDLARFLPNGELEYLGRIDHQVKVRGFRIELGEIETVLAAHPAVRETVVVVREDQPGEKRIVAYLSGEEQTIGELRRFVKEKLPDYMVPTAFVWLEALPLTPNGKVDRKALPVPEIQVEVTAGAEPRTEIERVLTEIWCGVLGLPEIGIYDNFFELGGDSILSIQIVSRANQAGLRVTPKQMFQNQTIAELADAIAQSAGTAVEVLAEQGVVTGEVPLLPIQQWFFEQNFANAHHWNQSMLLTVKKPLDTQVFAQAVQALLGHHDALRLRFVQEAGVWKQVNEGISNEVPFEVVNLANVPESDIAMRIETLAQETQASLHVSEGPVMRIVYFDLGAERQGRLLLVIHHLTVDGVSWRILLEDLQRAYEQVQTGERVQFPAKTTSYKQWAETLVKQANGDAWKQELGYWLAQTEPATPLPVDHPDGRNTEASLETVTLSLTTEETRALLQEVPAAYHTQINDVLLTALVESFARLTGQRELLLHLEGHGREEIVSGVDLSRTTGWFTTMFPVRLDFGRTTGWVAALKAVKEKLRRIPNKGIGYGLLRYLSDAADVLRNRPHAEISFNYLGQFDQVVSDEDALFGMTDEARGAHSSADAHRSHLLDVTGAITGGQLHMTWMYSCELHDRTTMEALAERFMEALRALIAHCSSEEAFGYTPSDFPLAKVDQQQLDRLIGAGRDVENVYPMSPLQQGLLFHTLYAEEAGDYVVQLVLTLQGDFQTASFEKAWQQTVDRHAILRTSFAWEGLEGPHQIVYKQRNIAFVHEDWQGEPAQEERLQALLQADRAKGFDFSQPPMRFYLIRLAQEKYQFVWSHHHVLLDGWSLPLVLNDVFVLYNSDCQGQKPELGANPPYAQYIGWLQRQDLQEAEHFWRKTLEGFTAPTPVGISGPVGEATEEKRYARQSLSLTEAQTEALQEWARRNQLTLNTMVQGAFALLLSRYSGETDVVFGATGAGRPADLPGVESMVGLFINTLPMRVQVDADSTVVEWLRQMQERQMELRQYEYSPLVNVQSWSEVPQGVPLFESLYVFESYPMAEGSGEAFHNLQISNVSGMEQTSYPITLVVAPGAQVGLRFMYDANRFDEATVERMLGHLAQMLEGIMIADVKVAEVPLLTEPEREQLLVAWNDTATDYPHHEPVHVRFSKQAESTPDAIAVVMGDETLTYGELNSRANRLAHCLQAQGVEAGHLVGICLERSPEMIISLLAVLKAGGAYVPMDPAYPQERLAYLLKDSQVQVLLTRESLLEKVQQTAVPTVLVDADWAEIARQSAENPVQETLPEHLAYVIYTSGSTGLPKGVQVTHGNLLHLVNWHQGAYDVAATDRATLLAGPAFDASVWETWPYLTAGASLFIPNEEQRMNPAQLRDWLIESNIAISFLPTPLAESLLALEWPTQAPLRYLLTGGDALHHRPSADLPFVLVNHYGPTECTVVTTAGVVEAEDVTGRAPSIGRPIANMEVYVLDEHRQPVPIGVPGELYVGGAGLTVGYLNRPDLTEKSFVPHPFSAEPGARLYRTGDLVRYLPDGNIEFIGRIDNQVKIRGFRIELGEIEAVLTEHPDVQKAVVLAREEEPGDKRLVAYVEINAATAATTEDLRRYSKGKLPEYMIPSAFVKMESLPLTANGKVDKKALPAPIQSDWTPDTLYVAPRNQAEELVANIFAGVLHVQQVGVSDNFFDLGGHSLLATQAISRLREAFGTALPVRALFENPTVAELAAHVQTMRKGEEPEPAIVPMAREGVDLPLSFAQQRMWFLDRFMPDSALYNIHGAFRLEGNVQVSALEQSLNVLVVRHESLRTTFAEVDGQAVQVIAPHLDFLMPILDLQPYGREEQADEVARLVKEDAIKPFDLEKGPLLRVTLLQLNANEFVMILNMHHIISDGWSMGVFLQELMSTYDAIAQSKPYELLKLPVQYADYAVWQRDWLQGGVLEEQLDYWKQNLQGAEPLLQLPTDRPRPAEQTFNGALTTVALPAALVERLQELSRQENVTLFMTLLSAFKTLLYRYTMQEDILVGSPIAGRNRSEIEGLIGFFVNTLVLRSDLSGNPSFKTLLAQVRETALSAYAHQDLPFEKIVDELQPERSLSYSPLFQVFFALQNAPMRMDEVEGMTVRPVEVDSSVLAKFDLSLFVEEVDDRWMTSFEYNTDLFDRETIARMAEQYLALLSSIVMNPEQSIHELPMLSAQELQQLEAWQGAKLEAVPNGCIHQLVEAQASRTPEATALIVDKQAVTYAELNARANQLAHHLRGQGVAAGHLVGICTERSVEMVVGLLGILKAGAAYVPLDPLYPADRIAYTLEDAQVSVLLTQDRLVADLPEHNAHVIRLDADWQQIAQASTQNPECLSKSDDLAYVIYTSGSTGRPKGVAIEHRNTVTFIAWAQQVFTPEQMSGVLASTSICFDLSVFELFATLSMGGKVILAENALYLQTLAAKHDVTLINTVPSAAAELVRMNGIPDSVRTVNLAGEPLPNALAQSLYGLGHVEAVYNLYGPSEDTTYSTYALVKKGATTAPTIGRPIANTEAYLLDPNGQRVPIGVPGELHLAGDGLARGYLHRADLTAEKFVANPFGKGKQSNARMYRTGDLARFLPNGELEYLGRIDHQVKVRGFRIELGEIETVLAAHPAVRETVVVVREDQPGEKRIVAYLSGEEQTIGDLRRFVKAKLPDYMVPTAFVWLEALPLTPNGKVDRKALPVPEIQVEVTAGAEPRTEIERVLTEIWCGVLGLPEIGIYDNFFELGGDSILSIQIVSRANQAGLRMTPKQMFQNQTIAELAATIAQNRTDLPEILAEQGEVIGDVPMLPVQKWFFEQEHPNPHHWNQSMLLTVKRRIDPAELQQALAALIAHHDSLRLRFEREAGAWKERHVPTGGEVPLQVIDLSDRPLVELKREIENAALEAQTSLDLTEGPLLRAVYFDLGSDLEARLLLVIHHLAVDGVSWRILLEDLQTACEQLQAGTPVQLPPKTTSYKQWAEQLVEYAQSEALAAERRYWLEQDTSQVVRIPCERTVAENTEESAAEVTLTLSEQETKALLHEALSQHRASMDEVLLSALGRALQKWTRKGSYLVHLEGHGREEVVKQVDLSRTTGWFTTIYPVLLDIGHVANLADALKIVKEKLRGIPNKGIGYGLLRYADPQGETAQALRAKVQAEISFNYLGQFDQVVNGDSLFAGAPESSGPNLSPTAKRPHLLDFAVVVIGGELRVTCFYGAHLHKRQTIEALVRDLLEGVRWFVAPEPGVEASGFTASDFPEADVDQASLNKVLKKLKTGKGR